MQKLVTIYLDSETYEPGKVLSTGTKEAHGTVEEHLGELLDEGWRIREINALGGHSGHLQVRGWVVAVLERDS